MKQKTIDEKDQTMLAILNTQMRLGAIYAGKYLVRNIEDHAAYEEKPLNYQGQGANPVTKHDRQAEWMLVDAFFNSDKIDVYRQRIRLIGEEDEYNNPNNADITVYMDPIDGTKSWVRGDFLSTVSIGLTHKDVLLGAVYDFTRDMMYVTHVDDQGTISAEVEYPNKRKAQLPMRNASILNRHKFYTTDVDKLESIVGSRDCYEQQGSIALSLAHLAYGAIDGLVMEPQPTSYYDVAGGLALLSAAGIKATDYDGKTITPSNTANGIIAIRDYVPLVH